MPPPTLKEREDKTRPLTLVYELDDVGKPPRRIRLPPREAVAWCDATSEGMVTHMPEYTAGVILYKDRWVGHRHFAYSE